MIKKYAITVNGVTYDVEVEELGTQSTTVSRTAPVQVEQKPMQNIQPQKPQTQVAQSQGSKTISAPMPGTINDVRVKAGDNVKKGQVLVILEAMKMENEIMASSDGTVSSLNVSKGASVSAGDVLVTIA